MPHALSPPGPKPKLPLANLLAFRRDPLGLLLNTARRYGDLAHTRFGSHNIYLLNHPDYIRKVLITHASEFVKSRGFRRYAGCGATVC